MTNEEITALANAIADDLFTDVRGKRAIRLVSEYEDNSRSSGWSHAAVVARVATKIHDAVRESEANDAN